MSFSIQMTRRLYTNYCLPVYKLQVRPMACGLPHQEHTILSHWTPFGMFRLLRQIHWTKGRATTGTKGVFFPFLRTRAHCLREAQVHHYLHQHCVAHVLRLYYYSKYAVLLVVQCNVIQCSSTQSVVRMIWPYRVTHESASALQHSTSSSPGTLWHSA